MTHDDDNLPDMENELARLTADAEAAIEQLRSKGLRDAMCPHDRIVVRVGDAKTWIASLGAKLPGILAENCSRSFCTSADPDMSQNPLAANTAEVRSVRRSTVSVAWQLRLIEHWPDIVREYGPSVEARAFMRYIKKHDESGVIVAHPVADELMWRTQLGDTKIVGLKTFKNAVGLLRKRGYLKT
ncbi:hypothetical protein [Burkholderia oklahomensis]|uniref:hypothetical protein n=2 Tax=Burkholderia oklahomensis TaxID=342113 RepID=UPI000B08242A|nr:hypothetical protein [Burkholderia oklahomensis]MBI0359945.1 hypothetical protein [Burkholderia oklahomensis]SUW59331.1 Uncharacterised protein [Burkholderia oklahomensis]